VAVGTFELTLNLNTESESESESESEAKAKAKNYEQKPQQTGGQQKVFICPILPGR